MYEIEGVLCAFMRPQSVIATTKLNFNVCIVLVGGSSGRLDIQGYTESRLKLDIDEKQKRHAYCCKLGVKFNSVTVKLIGHDDSCFGAIFKARVFQEVSNGFVR